MSSDNRKENKNGIVLSVLPFRIYPEREEQSFFSEGFTDDLISNFSRFMGLSVISMFSARQIKDLSDLPAIQKLHADYLVTGSFRDQDDKISIHVQLVRTSDWKVVYAFQHEEMLDSLPNSQDLIVKQIVNVLQLQIDYDLLSHSYQSLKVKFPAYEQWLLGMEQLKKSSPESNEAARIHFNKALEIDPLFARAYTGISLSYMNEWSCLIWERWDVSKNGAMTYAEKALELDDKDYISLMVMGKTYLFSGDYERSEHFLRKSLLMNPNDAFNLIQIAFCFMFLGYIEEARKLYEKACLLNPLHDERYFSYGSNIYFELGDDQKALQLGKRVHLDRTWIDFSVYMAAACFNLGDQDGAASYWQDYLKVFRQKIYRGQGDLTHEALSWHLNVNPYKTGTRLKKYREFLQTSIPVAVVEKDPVNRTALNQFALKGDYWELTYLGETCLVRDMKGLHDIQKLLQAPRQEIPCLDLMGSNAVQEKGVPLLDAQSRATYRKKVYELKGAIEDAVELGNPIEAENLRREYDQLLDHLGKSIGLGGKTRKKGSTIEKSRSAVTWRIRSAIGKIKEENPTLGKHLEISIRTGVCCTYHPEHDIDWTY